MVISHSLADVGPILLNNFLADVITKFLWQVLLPILFWADVVTLVCWLLITHCINNDFIAKQGGRCYCHTLCGRW